MKNQLNKSIIPQGFVAQPPKVAQLPVTNNAVTHEEIARRAYDIYIEKNYQQGRSEENWLQAEREQQNQNPAVFLLK